MRVPTQQLTTEYEAALDVVAALDSGRAHCRRLDSGELIQDAGLAVVLVVSGRAVIGSRSRFEEIRAEYHQTMAEIAAVIEGQAQDEKGTLAFSRFLISSQEVA